MKRRSFLRGVLAALATPITAIKALAKKDEIPEINIRITKNKVLARPRKLRSTWSMEAYNDVRFKTEYYQWMRITV
jgi:hypothetical protein